MKKLISAVLCTALIAVSILSVTAAQTSDDSSVGITLDDFMNDYKVIGEDFIPDNYARLYVSGSQIDPTSGIMFVDNVTKQESSYLFDFYGSKDVYLPCTAGYEHGQLLGNGKGLGSYTLNFNHTGGTYQKVRVNLSKFSDYFSPNGKRTSTLGGEAHDYNFTKEYDGIHSSSLIVISGGAITAVEPDHYGMAEFYISTQIGQLTFFLTDFRMNKGLTSAYGGGTCGQRFYGLTMGDVDKDGFVEIYDATCIQKHIAEIDTLSGISLRNGDVNRDGKCDIEDVTTIQKYMASI